MSLPSIVCHSCMAVQVLSQSIILLLLLHASPAVQHVPTPSQENSIFPRSSPPSSSAPSTTGSNISNTTAGSTSPTSTWSVNLDSTTKNHRCHTPYTVWDPAAHRCCAKCAVGFGVRTRCSSSSTDPQTDSDTKCMRCVTGMTFSDRLSAVDQCRPCSDVPLGAIVLRQCRSELDTLWRCSSDQYFVPGLRGSAGRCRQCSICLRGYGESQACTEGSNTVCKRCTKGTFSSSSRGPCRPCRECNTNEVVLKRCTPDGDARCYSLAKVNQPDIYRQPSARTNYTFPKPNQRHAEETTPVWEDTTRYTVPLYCSILGGVAASLVLYAIIKCVRDRRKRTKQIKRWQTARPLAHRVVRRQSTIYDRDVVTETTGAGNSSSEATTARVPLIEHLPRRLSDLAVDDGTFGVVGEAEMGLLHRGVDERWLEQLAWKLSRPEYGPTMNWSGLAAHLGFSAAKIESFDMLASLHMNPHHPLRGGVRYDLGICSTTTHEHNYVASRALLHEVCREWLDHNYTIQANRLLAAVRAMGRGDLVQFIVEGDDGEL